MKNGRNLRRYITSPEFSERVGDVVEEAVHDLEQRGFKPVYYRGEERATNRIPSMPADKLGRFMTGAEFLRRANSAVADAVRHLEARGIKPAYGNRNADRITVSEDTAQLPSLLLELRLPNPIVGAVLAEVFERGEHAELRAKLENLAATPAGIRQISDATVAIASSLLLSKTAMPNEDEAFAKRVGEQMASILEDATLVEFALLLIEGERNTKGDSFRDRNVISKALFEQRIEVIKQALRK